MSQHNIFRKKFTRTPLPTDLVKKPKLSVDQIYAKNVKIREAELGRTLSPLECVNMYNHVREMYAVY